MTKNDKNKTRKHTLETIVEEMRKKPEFKDASIEEIEKTLYPSMLISMVNAADILVEENSPDTFRSIDFLITDNAEKTLLRLYDARDIHRIPNLVFFKDGKTHRTKKDIDNDMIPAPDFSSYSKRYGLDYGYS